MIMSARDYMGKATRALAAARLLLDSGDVEGTCNRAYYAMFDAANAALLASGAFAAAVLPKKHSGLIAAVGLHLVKTDCISAELGMAINKVERLRRIADYTGEPIALDDARWAVEETAKLCAVVSRKWPQETAGASDVAAAP